MTQKFTINMEFPALNEPTHAAVGRDCIEQIKEQIRLLRIKPIRQARFEFFWAEKDRSRNKADVVALAKAYIIQALVEAEILKSGGWDHIVNWTDHFYCIDGKYEAQPGVTITMYDAAEEFKHLILAKDSSSERWNINEIINNNEPVKVSLV